MIPANAIKSILGWGWSATKGLGKILYKPGKTVIKDGEKKVVEESKGILPSIGRNPKNSLAVGTTGLLVAGDATGKGALGIVSDMIPGGRSLGGLASDAIFGKDTDAKDAAEKVGEVLIGKENTKNISDAVSSGVGAVSDAVSKGLEMVKGATNAIGDMISGIFSFFGGGMNPASADSAVSGVGGFQQMLSSMFGRNVNLSIPTVAMTVLGAWLGFGNHGFTGKIAGALLGALGLKNMFGGEQSMPIAQAARVAQQQDNVQDRQETADRTSSRDYRTVLPVYDDRGNFVDIAPDDVNGINNDNNRKSAYRR